MKKGKNQKEKYIIWKVEWQIEVRVVNPIQMQKQERQSGMIAFFCAQNFTEEDVQGQQEGEAS